MTGSGSDSAAWSGGPNGHVYSYSGPLYDVDARDGHVLRQITVKSATTLVASPDTPYFGGFDDDGNGRMWKVAPGETERTQISDTPLAQVYGVLGGELIGEINQEKIARLEIASGTVTTFEFPSTLTQIYGCENGSLSAHTVYLTCIAESVSSTGVSRSAGMLTFDLDTNTYGPYVEVMADADSLALASNVTNTPSGVIFSLYTGDATTAVRTAYKITGTSVSAGVTLPGNTVDLDEQGAVGSTVFLTELSENLVIPFDAATMSPGAGIAVSHPHHLVTGGGQVWVGANGHDGQLAKLDPATGNVVYKSFPRVVSTEIDWLAYGGE